MNETDILRRLQTDLLSLRSEVRKQGLRVSRKPLFDEAERLGTSWFNEVIPFVQSRIAGDVLDRYSEEFKRLLKISAPNNRKSSYEAVLDALTGHFRDELILPLQTAAPASAKGSPFDDLFAKLGSTDIDVYLKEAVGCAQQGFHRAAAVLGWCAAIDRIHHAIEHIGFVKFNIASASMASQTQGRFKRFNHPQNVCSMNDLRSVFDTDVLWVLEGMQLIDSNQHTRLRSCFDLRNHSAHPGEAPVTEYNLLSFFSDVIEIVLKNPVFQ